MQEGKREGEVASIPDAGDLPRCKMCGSPLTQHQRYFCSYRCKFEYEMKMRHKLPCCCSCMPSFGDADWMFDEE